MLAHIDEAFRRVTKQYDRRARRRIAACIDRPLGHAIGRPGSAVHTYSGDERIHALFRLLANMGMEWSDMQMRMFHLGLCVSVSQLFDNVAMHADRLMREYKWPRLGRCLSVNTGRRIGKTRGACAFAAALAYVRNKAKIVIVTIVFTLSCENISLVRATLKTAGVTISRIDRRDAISFVGLDGSISMVYGVPCNPDKLRCVPPPPPPPPSGPLSAAALDMAACCRAAARTVRIRPGRWPRYRASCPILRACTLAWRR